ncbi:MAG: TRAP transporter fused permease subunit, partial [Proteobacteria bacterium]|nr:TRAP transporter fused permease subunit [Pseudomonadota bacterium]
TLEGPYGFITGVSANYIFLFILFAGIIRNTAVGQFIMDFSMSVIGMFRGGPAKMAVIASSLMGMVSGSSLANVAGTGAFTIPLMKKMGYRPDFAGAVEATSSMGAQITPPVMGGSVFVMMELLSIPYWTICVAAFPIACLFYIGVFLAVDAEAVKQNLVGLPRKDLPSFWKTIKGGWFLVLPVVVLIGLLAQGYTPTKAGFWAIVSAVIVGAISKILRLNWRRLLYVLEEAAKDGLVVIGLVAAASLIQGIVSVTGLGLQLSGILIDLARGNLFVLLLLTAVTSIIMGMGLPILICYTLLALLVAPALIKMGVLPIAAHLFVFYYGVLSMITPPVAPDCFVAAGIANSDPLKVAFQAVRIGLPIFLIPFFFVVNPVFILQAKAPFYNTLWVFATGAIGVYAIAAGLQGIMLNRTFMNVFERCILFASGLLLLSPTILPSVAGLIVLVVMQVWAIFKGKRQQGAAQAA